nr:DUF6246 family protein [Xenorhabdus kozodoii]
MRKLQRHEGTEEFSDQFKAIEYINAARAHFNMSREEYDAVIDADDQRTHDLMSGKRRLVSMKNDNNQAKDG